MLPEKWCTIITSENEPILHKWYTEHIEGYKDCRPEWRLGIGSYFHYPSYNGHIHSACISSLKGYTEITFKQFLKEITEEYIPLIFN